MFTQNHFIDILQFSEVGQPLEHVWGQAADAIVG